ncbi:MAG: hypothetical protein M1828_002429 [Chrysothrix sp. TS-e1954]|nr:MAG: hypothetical protein M1828_002429 [Chrysothrix sp. TS-e1954]
MKEHLSKDSEVGLSHPSDNAALEKHVASAGPGIGSLEIRHERDTPYKPLSASPSNSLATKDAQAQRETIDTASAWDLLLESESRGQGDTIPFTQATHASSASIGPSIAAEHVPALEQALIYKAEVEKQVAARRANFFAEEARRPNGFVLCGCGFKAADDDMVRRLCTDNIDMHPRSRFNRPQDDRKVID